LLEDRFHRNPEEINFEEKRNESEASKIKQKTINFIVYQISYYQISCIIGTYTLQSWKETSGNKILNASI
jgi:hypothetical protein